MRLIDADAFRKVLSKYEMIHDKRRSFDDYDNGAANAYEHAGDLLDEMPTVEPKHGEWIPCSERLPKAGEYVGNVAKYYLVQNEYGDMLVARYTHSGYWEQIYQLKLCDDEIVAWMPLPEPYKKEGEE